MLPLLSSTIILLIRFLHVVDARAVTTTITSLPTSDISSDSSSILVDSGNGIASSQRCIYIDRCRTLNDIIRSCLVTILACVWFAVHRNIPAPEQKLPRHHNVLARTAQRVWSVILGQREAAVVFVVALLAPEWILAWALRQAMVAWKMTRQLEDARLRAEEEQKERCSKILDSEKDEGNIMASADGHSSIGESTGAPMDSEESLLIKRRSSSSTVHVTCPQCTGSGSQCDQVAAKKQVAKGDERWKWSHAFFVAMGGFQSYNKHGPLHPLSPADVVKLVECGHLVPPTAAEISDKSKGDALSKGVAISQTLWFVIQCIARRAERLPVTSLEVMTLAYTVMTVAMYTAWWAKPLNVGCPVRVPAQPEEVVGETEEYESIGVQGLTYVIGGQDLYVDLRECTCVPTFWAGGADGVDIWIPDFIALLVAMVFGAVHCIAWHSEFPSQLEQQLWRWSTIAIITGPLALAVLIGAGLLIGLVFDSSTVADVLLGIMYILVATIYVAARLILIALSFTSLKGLPFGAYQTVQWTTFIPHI